MGGVCMATVNTPLTAFAFAPLAPAEAGLQPGNGRGAGLKPGLRGLDGSCRVRHFTHLLREECWYLVILLLCCHLSNGSSKE